LPNLSILPLVVFLETMIQVPCELTLDSICWECILCRPLVNIYFLRRSFLRSRSSIPCSTVLPPLGTLDLKVIQLTGQGGKSSLRASLSMENHTNRTVSWIGMFLPTGHWSSSLSLIIRMYLVEQVLKLYLLRFLLVVFPSFSLFCVGASSGNINNPFTTSTGYKKYYISCLQSNKNGSILKTVDIYISTS